MGRKKGKGMTMNEYWRRKYGLTCILFTPSDQIVCCDNLGLGEWLREARIEAGFTLKQLAAKLGYSTMTLSNWENDLKIIRP